MTPGIRPVDQLGLEEHVGGEVGRGDVPLLPVEHVRVSIALRRGGDPVHIGAGALLGDGVALVDVTGDGGTHPTLHLMLGDHVGDPRRPGADHPAQGVGDPAGLLLDDRLFHHGIARSAHRLGHVDGDEPELGGPLVVAANDVLGEVPVVHLRLDLIGDELVDELAGDALQILLTRCQVHRRSR